MAKLTDQTLLATFAVEDEDWTVRSTAVRRLSDQATLAKIAVQDKEVAVRSAAVENLSDQPTLAKVAVEDEWRYVREAASARLRLENFTNQAALARVAFEAQDENVRKAAVERLTNRTLLARLAAEADDWRIRERAGAKLTNQPPLAKAATTNQALLAQAVEDRDEGVRLAAVAGLTDKLLLAKIAVTARDPVVRQIALLQVTSRELQRALVWGERHLAVRRTAVLLLTDQDELKRLAVVPETSVREAAILGIHDDAFLLAHLRRRDPSASVEEALARTLHGPTAIEVAATDAYFARSRMVALERLKDGAAADRVRRAHADLDRRTATIRSGPETVALIAQALRGDFDVISRAAAERLDKPENVEVVAQTATNRVVLGIVLGKLTNAGALERVAAHATDRAMRLAAERKLGNRSWEQIFDAATTGGKECKQALADACDALDLLGTVNTDKDLEAGLTAACRKLIRTGDEWCLPDLVGMLAAWGSKSLCELYFNSGHPELQKAAGEWATARGYDRVEIGASRDAPATWGRH